MKRIIALSVLFAFWCAMPAFADWSAIGDGYYEIGEGRQVPWGYETSWRYKDSNGKIYAKFVCTEKAPKDDKEILPLIEHRAEVIETSATIEPERIYTEKEVVDILVDKGYLEEGEKLDDLENSSQVQP